MRILVIQCSGFSFFLTSLYKPGFYADLLSADDLLGTHSLLGVWSYCLNYQPILGSIIFITYIYKCKGTVGTDVNGCTSTDMMIVTRRVHAFLSLADFPPGTMG